MSGVWIVEGRSVAHLYRECVPLHLAIRAVDINDGESLRRELCRRCLARRAADARVRDEESA